MLDVRPNAQRRAILMGLLVYTKIEIRKDSDVRLKSFMGLVELGEITMAEVHGDATGVMYRRFTLTDRGLKAARLLATL